MAAMNGRLNCILEICCPAPAAEKALAAQMVDDLGCEPDEAAKYAAWIREHFDLAPKGSLGVFKAEVTRLARQPQTPPGKNK